jgi:4-hydroxy-tetrahydrodipicolinate synthase
VLLKHYQKIAQRASCPIIIYNIPSRTHNQIHLESILKLSSNENIAGVKDSSGDFISFSRGMYTERQHDFAWIQGEDYLDAPSLLLGAKGIVTGLGNVWIEPYIEMYRETKKENTAKVHAAQKRINALYEIINRTKGKVVPATKAGAMLLGRSHKWMKSLALTLNTDEIAMVKEVLRGLKLL